MASDDGEVTWFEIGRRLQALASIGLLYTENGYDRERYEEIRSMAATMLATVGAVPLSAVDGFFATETGHPTPKTDVRCAIFDGDRLLLVRGSDDGGWTLPGGWAEIGETPAETAAREALEESGFVVRPTKLIALLDRDRQGHPPRPFACYIAFFLCELVGGSARPSIETTEAGFFAETDLPPLSVARITMKEIQLCFAHHLDPNRPTDFD